jgi:protein TonB
MPARRVCFLVVCSGVCVAGAHLAHAQEAASVSLPDQFQTGEMISTSKPKKKRTEPNSESFATARKQSTAPAPEQTVPAEELPPPILPSEEKKAEPSQAAETKTPNSTSVHLIKSAPVPEKTGPAVAPVEKKPRPKRRPHPAVQPEPAGIAAPVPMSLSVAQSMAIRAPLPQYPYEAKRRDLTGSGVCVITVDPETGKVTDATMTQSTGNRVLDKMTTETFKRWQFKPGTISEVRLPISYE